MHVSVFHIKKFWSFVVDNYLQIKRELSHFQSHGLFKYVFIFPYDKGRFQFHHCPHSTRENGQPLTTTGMLPSFARCWLLHVGHTLFSRCEQYIFLLHSGLVSCVWTVVKRKMSRYSALERSGHFQYSSLVLYATDVTCWH